MTTVKPRVIPLLSPRSDEPVKNQYIINIDGIVYFQSYTTRIAVYNPERRRLILGRDWNYSTTTSKYLHQFLKEYCGPLWMSLPQCKDFRNTLQAAIKNGLIEFDVTFY